MRTMARGSQVGRRAATTVASMKGREILDSRGTPTLEVDVYTTDGVLHRAAVPSGASTGVHEALELRDGGERYGGKGVLDAVANVGVLESVVVGKDPADQGGVDDAMLALDGTDNKGNLGANAILGASMALAKAGAWVRQVPLYAHLAELAYGKVPETYALPVPMLNVINGGEHSGNGLAMQEFMLAPTGAQDFPTALRMGAEVYAVLKTLLKDAYGPDAVAVGDEGGFAPNISENKEALAVLNQAITQAGYEGKIQIAMDVAASEFYRPETGDYDLLFKDADKKDGAGVLSGPALGQLYAEYASEFPIVSIEDPFDQDDWDNTAALTAAMGESVAVVGDDLLVTNVQRITTAIDKKACNALLLKVNQIGSVSESIAASNMARAAGWGVMVSHRSGETEDTFIADLAVGLGTGQIKTGAPCRSERTAKYNQLLRICEELGDAATFAGPGFRKF